MVRVNAVGLFFLVGAGAVSLACGNGTSTLPATSSGLGRSMTVITLTPTELGQLCDWSATRQGGYGHTVPCPDAGSSGPYDDRTTCVESIDAYSRYCAALTVGDYEDCINDLAAEACSIATNDGCTALRACLSVMP